MKTNILVTVIGVLLLLSIGYNAAISIECNAIQQKTKGNVASATSSIIPKAKVEIIADWSTATGDTEEFRTIRITSPNSSPKDCIEMYNSYHGIGSISCLPTR